MHRIMRAREFLVSRLRKRIMLATLFSTLSFIGLNHCGSTLWKLNIHKIMGHTLISSNKIMSAKMSVESKCYQQYFSRYKRIKALCIYENYFIYIYTLFTFGKHNCHKKYEKQCIEARRDKQLGFHAYYDKLRVSYEI